MSALDFRSTAVLLIAAIAVICDVRTRRIPNWLTLPAAALAIVWAAVTVNAAAAGTAAAGWLVGAALFFPFFALRGMGAGDVKLLAALGAWLGPHESVWLAMFAAMCGGVAGLLVASARGYLRTALANLWLMLTHWRVVGLQPVPGITLKDGNAPRLAYAIPIALGLVCTLWRH
jgi:prepilin peptidase CpaA